MTKKINTPPRVHPIQALNLIRVNAGLTCKELGAACGVTKQAIDDRLCNRKNTSSGVVCEMAEAMGYELALVPVGSDYPQGSIRLHAELADKHNLGGRR